MTHGRIHSAVRSLLIILAVGSLSATGIAQAPSGAAPLFESRAQGPGEAARRSPRAKRSRNVTATLDAFVANRGRANQRVLLNLFDDLQVVAKRQRVLDRPGDAFVWQGEVESENGTTAQGEVTLVYRKGILAGTVFLPGRSFEIIFGGAGRNEIMELDPAAFPTEDPDVQTPPDLMGDPLGPEEAAVAGDASTQIDIMVLWTPAARSAVGGTNQIQNLIDLAVATANTAYANSQVNTSLRLVYSAEISYNEASDISTDLSRLAGSADGYMDQIHTMRNTYAADIVSLIGRVNGACGIGYLLPSANSAYSNVGFNVVEHSCAAGNLSFAHEVGHNQGLHHDPPNASGSPAYTYAYGYQDPGGAFRTVMAYGSAPRVMRLSNPNLTYNGRVTGVANSQDNARALNNTAAAVANFRSSTTCSYTVSPLSASFPAGGGSVQLSISTSSGCSWTVLNLTGWVTTSASSGSGPGTLTLTASANAGSARSNSMNVAGKVVSVSQPAATSCAYTVSPTSASFPSSGGTTNVSITTDSSCSWSVTNGTGWVTTSATSGTGSATVSLTAPANTGGARSGSLTVAGSNVSVSQAAPACSYTVSPTSASFTSSGGTANVTITTGSTCSWSVSNATGWVTTSATSGTGSATVALTAPANAGGARSGSLTVAGASVSVSQAAAACTYGVSPTSASFTSSGGTVNVSITTGSTCSWSVSNSTGWVTTSATSGTGPATISLSAPANAGGARSGSLSVAGYSVSVSQAAAAVTCAYTVSPSSASFSSGGGSVGVGIETSAGCGWSVGNATDWVSVSASSGSGPATLMLSAPGNGGPSRSGTLVIAGQGVSVSQAAATTASSCNYSVSPSTVSFSRQGGSAVVTIDTGSTCSWSVVESLSWLSPSATSGTGPASVTLTAVSNPDKLSRSGYIAVGGKQVKVSQNGGPAPPKKPRVR